MSAASFLFVLKCFCFGLIGVVGLICIAAFIFMVTLPIKVGHLIFIGMVGTLAIILYASLRK
jgi:hypothetical protein